MPEIKNSFVRGRMNLDLDERLMPSGEYREALNIQVSTSEDSDVGSVQNVPGNRLIANFDELGVVGDLICIGSISDEKNNRLYWFVVDYGIAAPNEGIALRSAIIEYNVDLQLTTPIVVDIDNTFLEFSVNNYITGINIIDDFLFFTDGITEPKKINIEQFRKNNHTDISVNSDFFVFDENKGPVIKEQITVIKQKPTKPPVLDIIRTNKSAAFYKGENVTLENLNLSTLQPGDTFPGNGVPIKFTLPMAVVHPANTPASSYTDSVGNTYPSGTYTYDIRDKIGSVFFNVGQVLLLSDLSTVGGLPNSAEVKLKVNNIYLVGGGAPSSGGTETEQIFTQIDYSVISVDQPINPIATDYDYMVEDFSRLLFERGFPRFSYRYKYQDGEYSAFGPFTEVAFETGNFNIHPTREPYNSAMENNISQINIKDFVTYDIPEGVVEIDLLYKPENSTTVYSLDTIKPTKTDGTPNPFWTTLDGVSQTTITLFSGNSVPASDTGYFPITTDIIYAALPENQLLRPYDNVPKKAKSQDFTANRLIYGNYIQNLNLNQYDNNLSIEHLDRLNYYPKIDEDPKKAKQSVKSQRTYQVGISFLDLYGRETPVFTSGNTGSVTIPFDDDPTLNFVGNASRSLQLVANNIPTIEHVYQTVKVTGIQHSSGSNQDGRYFFFEISDMNNLLAQEYDNFSVHNIKQYRAGQLIYEGPVRIWNQESDNSGSVSPSGGATKGHGRRGPNYNASSTSDWLVDDVVTIETDARFFKLFVKETASEYYNLILDRIYRAEEDGNLWLSFPSSDRNKLKEDDFIILKKSINANAQVEDENKFKVIDIKNEAPDFIKSKYRVLGTFNGNGTLTGSTGLFPDSGLQPRANSNKLIISEEAILSEGAEKLQPLFDDGKGISIKFQKDFNNGLINSQRYEIISLETVDSSPSPLYKITLDKDIEEQDGWVEDSVGVLTPTLTATIRLEIKREYEEFQGRFFVKILSNIITAQYLEQQIDIQENQIFNARKEIFALITSGLIYGAGLNPGIVAGSTSNIIINTNYYQSAISNIDPDPASNGVTATTQSDWQEQLKFGGNTVTSNWFIDEMYFAAHQPNKSPNFNEAGYANPGQYNWIFPANNDHQFDVSISGSLMNHTVPGGSDLVGTTPGGVTVQFGNSPNGVNWSHFGSGSDNVYSSDGGVINGLEGIEQANATYNNYTSGPKAPRAWKSQIHTGQNPSQYVEEVYGPQNSSGFYMHLSYSTVGVDLHDGVNLKGNDATDPVAWYNDNADDVTDYQYSSDFKAQINLQAIQNNNTQGGFSRMVCNVPQKNIGTNLEEKTRTQWDPVGSNILGNYSASNEQFISQLVPGNKFTFNNDTSQEVFTIIDVHVKRIYNHTAWNRKIRWNISTDKFEEDPNTVHYAWHKFVETSHLVPGTNSNSIVNTLFDRLKKMIKRFGAADNRRVCYILRLDKDPRDLLSNPEALGGTSTTVESDFIQFQQPYVTENDAKISENPAVFETEPKEDLDLDIYYEATQAYPLKLDKNNSSDSYLSASVGDRVSCSLSAANLTPLSGIGSISYLDNRVKSWDGNIVTLESGLISQTPGANDPVTQTTIFAGQTLSFHKLDYSFITYEIEEILPDDFGDPNQISIGYGNPPGTTPNPLYITKIKLKPKPVSVGLSYFNCFSFGNGVESNRIRDDFNQQFIKNGVKASTTLQQQYLEDRRTSGLIFSGLYNKNTSLNDLNQFIMAEKITKELEPTYGSIQKLFARDSDLIALCEDKIVQIFADKDAIFNADGNPQLVASNRVLGQSRPFVGEYGISKNPETFASSSYRAYFADKQRGAVLRLSMDGLTPISDAGMKDWFRDKLKGNYFNIIGSYDTNKDHYNITFDSGDNFNSTVDFKEEESSVTVSYKESVKGWVSFKGFIQESGVSCVNTYFTIRNGSLYSHDNDTYNQFYGSDQNSYVTSIFNNSPTTVKHFNTLNYDGQEGWTCDFINTDLNDDGQLLGDFINKENKYFAAISNNGSILSDEDTSSFGFQGIGIADSIQINI